MAIFRDIVGTKLPLFDKLGRILMIVLGEWKR
jgi:hypothetical protein